MSTIADSSNLTIKETSKYSRKTIRLAVSLFYFGQGLVFASWASRIPDLKTALNLSDAALGSILLALPIGQLITMPLSGRLVAVFGSKKILITSSCCNDFIYEVTDIPNDAKPKAIRTAAGIAKIPQALGTSPSGTTTAMKPTA